MAYTNGAFTVYPSDFVYFITTTVIDWVDVFTRENYRRIIAESLEYCRLKKGLNLHAWVLMTNHLHLIVSHNDGRERLAQIMSDFKKFTAKKIIKAIMDNPRESRQQWMLRHFREENILRNPDATCAVSHALEPAEHYHLWQRGYHAHAINNIGHMRQKLDYLHANPVRAGLVQEPWEFLYSSARNYCGESAVIDIDEISLGLSPNKL